MRDQTESSETPISQTEADRVRSHRANQRVIQSGWNQAIQTAVLDTIDRPLLTIQDVVELLEETSEALDDLTDEYGQNPVRAFNILYTNITRAVRDNIASGVYTDPEFMEILDVEFAKLYFQAIKQWLEGDDVPIAWEHLFLLEDDGYGHTDFEGALLGVNAHINRDLTYALINAEARAPKTVDLEARERDFELINDIFVDQLNDIVNALIASLTNRPWKFLWKFVDTSLGVVDETMMSLAIVKFRARAWKRAENFWKVSGPTERPIYKDRSKLSAHLASLILNVHAFDTGPFVVIDPDYQTSATKRSRPDYELFRLLPAAGEILLGSDLLSIEIKQTKITVSSPNQQIDGSWQGNQSELHTLFDSLWLHRAIDAEPEADFDPHELTRTAKVVSIYRSSLPQRGDQG